MITNTSIIAGQLLAGSETNIKKNGEVRIIFDELIIYMLLTQLPERRKLRSTHSIIQDCSATIKRAQHKNRGIVLTPFRIAINR